MFSLDCNDVVHALYNTVVQKPAMVSSPAELEMVKLLENTFRAVNIGLNSNQFENSSFSNSGSRSNFGHSRLIT